MSKIHPVPAEWAARAYVDAAGYAEKYRRSIEEPLAFWREETARLDWIRPWTQMSKWSFDEADFGKFLELLPRKLEGRALRHVVEVRHDSFCTPAFIALLRKFEVPVVFAEHGKYPAIADIAPVAAAHHERLDGTGYPFGLDQRTISRETRIITVCDFFDALTADRPYRAALTTEEALDIMRCDVGKAIDGDCFDALRAAVA